MYISLQYINTTFIKHIFYNQNFKEKHYIIDVFCDLMCINISLD